MLPPPARARRVCTCGSAVISGCPCQRILDRPPGQLAGFDHILGGGGVVGLGVPDHVDDVRFERHLQVDAGRQVGARGRRVERVAEQAGAGLPPDAEISVSARGSIRSRTASIFARSMASESPGGLLNINWAM